MEYDNFMFDEAFEFHNKHQQTNEPNYDEELVKVEERRLPPLGACSSDIDNNSPYLEGDELTRKLQEQHDQLNLSLLALTSHFAQVQFRLKQIIQGPRDDQENLLAELEDFAFAGCPDVVGPTNHKLGCPTCSSQNAIEQYENRIAEEKERGKRLDSHLKKMISELEVTQKQVGGKKSSVKKKIGYEKPKLKELTSTYTFEPGEQLEVSDDEVDAIPQEDLKQYIDTTMAKLINPRKAKEDVISQVSKQICDMEKFVTFLQGYESTTEVDTDRENIKEIKINNSKNTAPNNGNTNKNDSQHKQDTKIPAPHTKILKLSEDKRKKLHEASIAVLKKGMAVLQIFAISQFGCSARHFREYMMRKTETATASTTGYVKPYETLRSSVDRILMLHTKLVDVGGLTPDSEDELNLPISSSDKRASWSRTRHSSQSTSSRASFSSQLSTTTLPDKPIAAATQEDLIRLVRGEFSMALKELIQHGLCQSFQTSKLSTKALVGCMSSHTITGYGLHIWEYFNKFYQLKRGDDYNNQPSHMLSEAFAMDVGCTQQTPKQSLLTVLYRIKTTHEPRKRSFDAMYKALISAGLNRGRLAQWIRLVIRCPELIDRHYERWSYVIRSGFDDVLTALEKLSSMTFFLPEDLAIRHLLKNTNEFGDA